MTGLAREGCTLRRGLFFVGTDTGVGKTFVTAWVARWLRLQGHAVSVRKPVATGAGRDGDAWVSDDTRTLAEAAGCELRHVTCWTFPEAVAPPVAARRHGIDLTLEGLHDAACRNVPAEDVLLVEGVGGLLCPLTESDTVADLARLLALPLVLVARRALGTLSQTLLAVEVARNRGLPLAGVVVSETTPCQTLAEETNVAELRARLAVPLLAVARHAPDLTAPQPDLEAVDWWRLVLGPPEPERVFEERTRPWIQ